MEEALSWIVDELVAASVYGKYRIDKSFGGFILVEGVPGQKDQILLGPTLVAKGEKAVREELRGKLMARL